ATLASRCTMCVLAETRTNVVFGSGAPDADVMIVGEGPGQAEDEQGEPFVGRSGQLLASLLGEIGLERSDVYIANVVKCRPPRNRDPRADEIDACKGYLRRQIQLVDPLVVVTVGNFSTRLALRTETGITRLRGAAYPWWGRYLVPTYHPAAALRGGDRVTDDIRADLRLVRSIIDGNLIDATTDGLVREPDEGQRASIDHQLDLFGGQT
ncbi:MAG: uracil-DNA glycosylase, partial [Acidimicrobiia bacterium]